jgi:hypothetical protein
MKQYTKQEIESLCGFTGYPFDPDVTHFVINGQWTLLDSPAKSSNPVHTVEYFKLANGNYIVCQVFFQKDLSDPKMNVFERSQKIGSCLFVKKDRCDYCGGKGQTVEGGGKNIYQKTCKLCDGTGVKTKERCKICNGSGEDWDGNHGRSCSKCSKCNGTGAENGK